MLREKRGGGALLTEKETEREQRQVMLMEESVRERERDREQSRQCVREEKRNRWRLCSHECKKSGFFQNDDSNLAIILRQKL